MNSREEALKELEEVGLSKKTYNTIRKALEAKEPLKVSVDEIILEIYEKLKTLHDHAEAVKEVLQKYIIIIKGDENERENNQ